MEQQFLFSEKPSEPSTAVQGVPKCGVYRIVFIPDGRVYIGSSLNIPKRWYLHLYDLRTQRHHSKRLQKVFDEHGEESLRFEVLEETTEQDRFLREQHYMDSSMCYRQAYGFNNREIAGDPEWFNKGKRYVITHPDGREEEVRNLSAFCRTHGLRHAEMSALANCRWYEAQGYKCRYPYMTAEEHRAIFLQRAEEKLGGPSYYNVTSPVGEVMEVRNLMQFCLKQGIGLCGMYNGGTRGWKCERLTKSVKGHKPSKQYVITHPDGREEAIERMSDFCREHGLLVASLHNVAKGRINHHKGYRCRDASMSREEWEARDASGLYRRKQKRHWIVTSPSGESFTTRNLRTFCKERPELRYMEFFTRGSSRGWTAHRVRASEE